MKSGFIVLCGCLLASHLWARQGVVETRDGHVYEGHIRFDSNLLVVANAARDLLAFVDLTNLAEVTFSKEARPPGVEAAPADGLLPGPWQNEDVGSVVLAGSASKSAGLLRVNSSGTNIFGQSDSFHFVYKAVKGDSEIVARVLQVQYSAPWARAGLMMRESLAADSPNVLLGLTPLRLGVFQWREGAGGITSGEAQRDMLVPYWIRLRRDGNTFTASKSRNGRQWTQAGKATIPMTEEVFVGMAVAGVPASASERGPLRSNRSLFDHVREAPFLLNESFIPVVQLQSGSRAVGRVSVADEWQIQLAGAPSPAPISTLNVARILFRWLPYGLTAKISSGRPGVLLTTGDFIEGEFKGIENGQVKISSVLLGLRSFSVNEDTIAVVLRNPSVQPRPQYEVTTLDGSVWVGAALQIEKDQLVLQERSLGSWRIPLHEVLELKRRADGLEPRPTRTTQNDFNHREPKDRKEPAGNNHRAVAKYASVTFRNLP